MTSWPHLSPSGNQKRFSRDRVMQGTVKNGNQAAMAKSLLARQHISSPLRLPFRHIGAVCLGV